MSTSATPVSPLQIAMLTGSVLMGLALTVFNVNGAPFSIRDSSSTLEGICSSEAIGAALPANDTILGLHFIPGAVTTQLVYNTNATGSQTGTDTSTAGPFNYCNVTIGYTHAGTGDNVVVEYALPEPSSFKNRFYVGGGGGFVLNADSTGGLPHGAVSGATDAGYNALQGTTYDEVNLLANGTINWDATYMFSYQALGELTKIGKALTKSLYDTDTLYTYFEGCSDGGREGHSQIQKYPEEYDGVISGAPAFRYAQQQVQHLFSNVVIKTIDYLPKPCELSKIVNLTIEGCDAMDGRVDGVISRTDMCQLNFDFNTTVGETYYCAADDSTPEQTGTITYEAAEIAKTIYQGLIDSKGDRAYFSYQIGSEFEDADITYNNETNAFEMNIKQMGGVWVARWVDLLDMDNLQTLDNVTYDTLVEWMLTSNMRYYDSLQTIWPDMSRYVGKGGKLLHFHGESDPSIPAASSVHYWQSVINVMYPNATLEEAAELLDDWYQFYLVPGAAHCERNPIQDGPYPETNMQIMIDWVENGVKPTGLKTSVSSGPFAGEEQSLCKFPLRPVWSGNNSDFECIFDQVSYDAFTYTFPAFKLGVY